MAQTLLYPSAHKPDTDTSPLPPDYVGNVSPIQPNSRDCCPIWQWGKTEEKPQFW